jgi:hypothetical protein
VNLAPAKSERPPGPIHPTAVLVDASVVAAVRGVPVDRVFNWVDGDRNNWLLWVWNVGAQNHGKRELRFWSVEINQCEPVASLAIETVIDRIVPRRNLPGQSVGLRNWELAALLNISRSSLQALRGELAFRETDEGIFYGRETIVSFLQRRWLFRTQQKQRQANLI